MTRRAILLGALVAIALFGYMIWNGLFMGARDVECLPYADCEFDGEQSR